MLQKGTFLYNLIHPPPPEVRSKPVNAHYDRDEYIRMLRKNAEYWDIPFKEPYVVEIPRKPVNNPEDNCPVKYLDHIPVNLSVLKNGKIKIKIFPHVAQLNEKYFSKNKQAPLNALVSAFKAVGASDTYIEKMTKTCNNKKNMNKKFEKLIALIFDKKAPSATAIKKKPQKPKDPEEESEDEEEEEEVVEDEGIDIDEFQDEPEEVVEDMDMDDF